MKITLLGTRGSVPNPSRENYLYGGNTQCVAVTQDACNILLDAGTGLLMAPNVMQGNVYHILLSHFHLDHINGIPMFDPLFESGSTVHFYAPMFEGKDVRYWMGEILRPPFWPICPDEFFAHIEYHTVMPGESFLLEDTVLVSTIALNHPNGAMGYSLSHAGKRLCYISDHEHTSAFEKPISAFVKNCDVMIADACYTPEQYAKHKVGFGHSVFEDVAQLAVDAGVKQLIITHHDGKNNDLSLAALEKELQVKYPNSAFAREDAVTTL